MCGFISPTVVFYKMVKNIRTLTYLFSDGVSEKLWIKMCAGCRQEIWRWDLWVARSRHQLLYCVVHRDRLASPSYSLVTDIYVQWILKMKVITNIYIVNDCYNFHFWINIRCNFELHTLKSWIKCPCKQIFKLLF